MWNKVFGWTRVFPRTMNIIAGSQSGFEWNKIFAAILLAGLVAMVAGFIAKLTVHPEKLEKNVYVVAGVTEAASTENAAPAGPQPIEGLLATADVAAGEQTAKQCAACHSFGKGEPAKVGPNLWGIVGNVHGHMEGFSYSDAMMALHDKRWDYAALNEFIYSPRQTIKGTKMTFAGLKDTKQRANVIAWLRTLSDSPVALPPAQAAAAPAAPAKAAPADGAAPPTPAAATPAAATPAAAPPAKAGQPSQVPGGQTTPQGQTAPPAHEPQGGALEPKPELQPLTQQPPQNPADAKPAAAPQPAESAPAAPSVAMPH